jgi:putative IMPACT (imprinted ancient) family translation regulator
VKRPTGVGVTERSVRNSRFIAVCGPASDDTAAREFVAAHGEPGCRHVAWACRCGDVTRFDDAGEPGGTAGRPMLAALEHFQFDRAVVVVSRFFGGVKLGTGGLARAYGGSAMDAIAATPCEPVIDIRTLTCRVPFEAAGELHRLIERFEATKLEERWRGTGLQLTLELPANRLQAFTGDLAEATRGAAETRARLDPSHSS